ncbi:MAG: glycosyltransferase family 1 protein [Proteobacteria bacterium]|nr:glycosyltransferase family 1 protein [Pseudomonadota bacterium]NBP14209.1 glycosyltransferase family 1 protein [bacterium]
MNIISPINQLGYGITGLNIVKSLSKLTKVALWPIGQPQVVNQNDADIISKALQNAIFFDPDKPCIRIWHQHDMSQFVGRAERIGFPIFELDEFNAVEKHHLNTLDKIFVCSSWAKNIILNNTKLSSNNVYVVPLGVDQEIFNTDSNNKSEKTIFFNCGKWEIRKGHDIIPEIFNKAFEKDDNVELWMMNSNPFIRPEDTKAWQNLYNTSKLGSKIRFIDRVDSQKEVYNIMQQTDCGLFPARAEGWNLELLEMLSCGKHVITTNYSAHTEFCNPDNALLIDIEEHEMAYDGQWFHGKCGKWAKIGPSQIEQAVHYCRMVHNEKQNGNLIINKSGIQTGYNFSWENSAKKIIKYV